MKIRTDFVTNSSSPSFVTFKITDKRLDKFLHEMFEVYEKKHPWGYCVDASM